MDVFPREDLRMLVEARTVGCISVSMYMPTFKPGRAEVQQNHVRLKKLLRDAEGRLMERGLRRPEAIEYLEPAAKLLEDAMFWAASSDGLAIFLSKDYFRYYRLPAEMPERVVVAESFHVKPLLPLLAFDGRFYVLAISKNLARLFECTGFGARELDIAGKIPRSMAEALQYDHFDRDLQFHMHAGRQAPGSEAVAPSHGDEPEDTKENLLRYFQMVDRGLQREFLHNETAPLVIVGVDYLFPLYRQANTYANLLETPVRENPDDSSATELQQKAMTVVRPYLKEREERAAGLFSESAGAKRTATDLEEVVVHAYRGRVHTLFVSSHLERWGTYDADADRVIIHSREESCDVDLFDFAAANTLAHRGDVHVVEAGELPGGGEVAAILRY